MAFSCIAFVDVPSVTTLHEVKDNHSAFVLDTLIEIFYSKPCNSNEQRIFGSNNYGDI